MPMLKYVFIMLWQSIKDYTCIPTLGAHSETPPNKITLEKHVFHA